MRCPLLWCVGMKSPWLSFCAEASVLLSLPELSNTAFIAIAVRRDCGAWWVSQWVQAKSCRCLFVQGLGLGFGLGFGGLCLMGSEAMGLSLLEVGGVDVVVVEVVVGVVVVASVVVVVAVEVVGGVVGVVVVVVVVALAASAAPSGTLVDFVPGAGSQKRSAPTPTHVPLSMSRMVALPLLYQQRSAPEPTHLPFVTGWLVRLFGVCVGLVRSLVRVGWWVRSF